MAHTLLPYWNFLDHFDCTDLGRPCCGSLAMSLRSKKRSKSPECCYSFCVACVMKVSASRVERDVNRSSPLSQYLHLLPRDYRLSSAPTPTPTPATMAFASDSDDDIVALNTPQPQFRSTALMRAQRTGPSAASSAPASRHAALAARDPYTTASTTKPTTSLLKGLSSDSEDDLNDQTLRKSPFNQINGFQKSARPPSTSTAGSMASRQPTSRTRSDTNLLSSCTSTSNGLGSSHKSISLSRRGGMARAHTTGPAGSSSSKRPALMPSSLKNSVGMFGSDSDDSGLSADEDIRRSIYKSRTLELDSQTSSTSATKTTTTTKGRSRSDPSEKARAAEAKKVRC